MELVDRQQTESVEPRAKGQEFQKKST